MFLPLDWLRWLHSTQGWRAWQDRLLKKKLHPPASRPESFIASALEPDTNSQLPGVPDWVDGVKPKVRRLESPEPAISEILLQLALFQHTLLLIRGIQVDHVGLSPR